LRTPRLVSHVTAIAAFLLLAALPLQLRAGIFTPEDALSYKSCYSVSISPSGEWIAYTVSVPRKADEEAGGAYSELYLVSVKTGEIRPFITGEVNVSSPRFSPDGSKIAFLMKRGKKAKTQIWTIPVDGGESIKVTKSKTGVSSFRWHPGGIKMAYIATTKECEKKKKLDDKGYGFIFFEENLRHRNLYIVELDESGEAGEAEQLTEGITIWSFEFNADGSMIAAAASEKNLIDYNYMFKKIYLLDPVSKELTQLTSNPGKLGNYAFSPDGKKLAYTAALERKDHAVSQIYVIDTAGGEAKNLTEPDFRGHVNWGGWKNNKEIMYVATEGFWTTLNTVKAGGGTRKTVLHAEKAGVVIAPSSPSFTADRKHFAFVGTAPDIPRDAFYWKWDSKSMKRMTTLNPWIAERDLGRQEIVRYKARDGLDIEGLLIYPVDYREGNRYPLIVGVHGGPEANYTNRWVTGYFNPGQVLAGKGYVTFYPNYRASTGYGVEFAAEGYMDAAGKEFDDIADGIDFLVSQGIADPERVGLGGGSYGGFAAAWFSSFYTQYVKAVCMFVGISDLISKRSTTDIPYEELYVHSGKKLEEMWQMSLERSPIYWAHQSESAVLILGGTADSRVHPSQSLEYYRRLKMNDHPAVRWVKYPGEGHGNRKQPGRIDVLYRHLQWYDWYVKEKKPLDGAMPPLDISDWYGLELEEDEEE
jgi:dipeptidyl aminopeptidase/acylaminoacyl peptidase